MRQQLLRLVSNEIKELQNEVEFYRNRVKDFDLFANKEDPSDDSKTAFKRLNECKNLLRRQQRKLEKMVAVQKELKKMYGYLTFEE